MDVLLANPRGFCAGVERAIEIVERAITQFGAPISFSVAICFSFSIVIV